LKTKRLRRRLRIFAGRLRGAGKLRILASIRIMFFGTIENPEPRYFVELFIPAAILSGVF